MTIVSASVSSDELRWWPTACVIAIVALFVFVGSLPGPLNVPLALLAVIVFPIMALLLICAACKLDWQRRPRGAASALLALVAPILLLIPMVLLQPYVHLGLTLAFGIGYIGPAPHESEPVSIYDWSTGIVGGPNTFLIRDDTDAIALPQTKGGPPTWRNNEFLIACSGRVQHLIEHYYICVD